MNKKLSIVCCIIFSLVFVTFIGCNKKTKDPSTTVKDFFGDISNGDYEEATINMYTGLKDYLVGYKNATDKDAAEALKRDFSWLKEENVLIKNVKIIDVIIDDDKSEIYRHLDKWQEKGIEIDSIGISGVAKVNTEITFSNQEFTDIDRGDVYCIKISENWYIVSFLD